MNNVVQLARGGHRIFTSGLTLLAVFALSVSPIVAQNQSAAATLTVDDDEAVKQFDLSFDDLTFKLEKTQPFDRSLLTDTIKSYDGGIVKLRGYIRPSVSQRGLTRFIFVRDNKKCCFGPKAALYDNVLVKLAEGETTDFTVRPITIEGKFYLKEYLGPDDQVWSIYRMKDAVVK